MTDLPGVATITSQGSGVYGVQLDPPNVRWDPSRRGSRLRRGILATLLTIEVLGVLLLLIGVESAVVDDPLTEFFHKVGLEPGEQVLTHFDIVRASVFLCIAVAAVAALVVASVLLWRSTGKGTPTFPSWGGPLIAFLAVGNVVCAAVCIGIAVITENRTPESVTNDPTSAVVSIAVFYCLAATYFAVAVLLQRGLRPSKRTLAVTLLITAVFAAGLVAVSILDIGSYQSQSPIPGAQLLPVFDDGFWNISVVQHPASGLAVTASCNGTETCVLWGSGNYHRLLVPSGEVTVTVNGGHSWQSWLLPKPLDNNSEPFGLWPGCVDDQCISPVVSYATGPGFYRLSIDPRGHVSGRAVGVFQTSIAGFSCPSISWCAGMSQSSSGSGSGSTRTYSLAISSGQNMGTHLVPLPSSVFPKATENEGFDLVCPAVDHCLLAESPQQPFGSASSAGNDSQVVGGSKSVVAITDNGGQTWLPVSIPMGTDRATDDQLTIIQRIECPSPTNCMALVESTQGATGFVRSDDGGVDWEYQPLPKSSTPTGYPHLACGSPNQCVILPWPSNGSEDALRTMDGGRQWQSVPLPYTSQIFGVACTPTGVCVATAIKGDNAGYPGSTPQILISQDAGATWKMENMPVPKMQVP